MSGLVINIDPAIFRLGSFEFRWYSLMILIATIAGIAILLHRGQRKGISKDNIYSLLPWVFIGGILGARLFHVLDNFKYYWDNPLLILQLQLGGLAIWGALVGGSIIAAIYCNARKIPFVRLLDAAVPALLVAQMIGRVGCIINGDAYGGLTNLPWAFIYTNPHAMIPAAYLGLPTHPYPVYEMVWNGIVLLGIWRLERFFKRDGMEFLAYLAFYAVGRFLLTFVRQENVWFWGMQEAQVISIVIFLAAATSIGYLLKKSKDATRNIVPA